jgi:hypothetical protein
VSGLIQAVSVVTAIVRRRTVDTFAVLVLVLVELALGVALNVVSSGDPRFLLVRTAFYTFVAAVYIFGTAGTNIPLMYVASRPMAVAGDPRRDIAFTRAWDNSAAFRRIQRMMTVGLGVVLLAEAVLRVVIVFRSAATDVIVTSSSSQLPVIVLFVLSVIGFRVLAVPRVSAIVDAEQAAVPELAPAGTAS